MPAGFGTWVSEAGFRNLGFETWADARTKIPNWHQHYNSERPHSSLGYRMPDEFPQNAANQYALS